MVLGLLACSETPEIPVVHFSRPLDVALVCLDADGGIPLASCDGTAGRRLQAVVLNGESGSLTRVALDPRVPGAATVLDDDAFTPGYTARPVGTAPVALVATRAGDALIVADSASPALTRLDAKTLAPTRHVLPASPAGLVVSDDAVYVALPDAGAVARIALDAFEAPATLFPIDGATPYDVEVTTYGTLWVSNADVGWVALLDAETGELLKRVAAAPSCRDDLDNDGDGAFDAGDASCRKDPRGRELGGESPPGPRVAWPSGHAAPSCYDGADDDGDGNTDYPADSDCLSAADDEAPAAAPVLARLALSPDERFVYVTNARERAVEVIDADLAAHVEVNAGDGGNSLYRTLGRTGVGLPGVPTDVSFAKSGDTVKAVITSANGNLFFVRVMDSTGPVHVLDSADTLRTEGIFSPTLSQFVFNASGRFLPAAYGNALGGLEALSLGGDRRPDFPSFGDFVVRRDIATSEVLSWYGIEVVGDAQDLAPNEFWALTHADVVVDRRAQGALLSGEGGTFASVDRPFCTGGVEAGDWLVVFTADLDGCPDDYAAGAVAWPVTAVAADELTVDPSAGRVVDVDGTDLGGEGVAYPSKFAATGAPHSCLRGQVLRYVVQAPPGTYVVRGGTSGALHPWVEGANGQCVEEDGAQRRSRTREWTLAKGKTLDRCPITDAAADEFFEGEHFENHAFRLRVLPGCSRDSKTGITTVLETPWLARWSFQAQSSRTVRLASSLLSGLPRGLTREAPTGLLYYVDPASNQLFGIEGLTGTVRLRTN